MFKVGPNPYGMCFSLGIQGKNPHPREISWFIGLAEEIKARSIEFHYGQLLHLGQGELEAIRERLSHLELEPIISGPWPLERLSEAFPIARLLGARTVRTHLSNVLCGARHTLGDEWQVIVSNIRSLLPDLGQKAIDSGIVIAIENHQDFRSEELLDFCDLGGPGIGVCFDTGNPLAVGEDPEEFARQVSEKVRHVHLKDYRAQATPEGFKLIRCAIGDGTIQLSRIANILSKDHIELTASLEPGAHESRHIRLLTDDWHKGYAPRELDVVHACMAATRFGSFLTSEDGRTPWEAGEGIEEICRYEEVQMMKSVRNMQRMGWLPR